MPSNARGVQPSLRGRLAGGRAIRALHGLCADQGVLRGLRLAGGEVCTVRGVTEAGESCAQPWPTSVSSSEVTSEKRSSTLHIRRAPASVADAVASAISGTPTSALRVGGGRVAPERPQAPPPLTPASSANPSRLQPVAPPGVEPGRTSVPEILNLLRMPFRQGAASTSGALRGAPAARRAMESPHPKESSSPRPSSAHELLHAAAGAILKSRSVASAAKSRDQTAGCALARGRDPPGKLRWRPSDRRAAHAPRRAARNRRAP